ncbi:hypothetical protein BGX24_008904 [Mortierella sp. AD032]|nr:hypothetical protein BGX24_008904 [Mortierella sp. AD032]
MRINDPVKMSVWRRVYRQLGELKKLATLTIRCIGLQTSSDAGIEYLYGLPKLAFLTLSDDKGMVPVATDWTRSEIKRIVGSLPKLIRVDLNQFVGNNRLVVEEAMEEFMDKGLALV